MNEGEKVAKDRGTETLPMGARGPNANTHSTARPRPAAVGFVSRTPTRDGLEGARLGGYEVLERLGAGGMGVVYRARDVERKAIVALKTLRRMDATGLSRLKSEFRAVADIVHPNLVMLHELVADGDECFFTMELIDGTSFLRWVRDGGALREADAETLAAVPDPSVTIVDPNVESKVQAHTAGQSAPLDPAALARLRDGLRQLAAGVSALHAAGKLHRDLKPSNVLVTREGRVVVLDFGLVTTDRTETRARREAHRAEDEDATAGTPAYMAPEQVRGEALGPATDWYAFGVVLFEALTGSLPFSGSLTDLVRQKLFAPALRPSDLTRGVPPDLDELCVRLLSPEPKDRPTGAEVLRILGAEAEAATPPSASSELVGREAELSELERAFEDARRGSPVTVQVHGPSGMGKSALLRAFIEPIRSAERALVLEGRCYERESVPYKAFDGVVEALTAHLRSLSDDRLSALLPDGIEDLARVFPVLAKVAEIRVRRERDRSHRDPTEVQRRAFRCMKQLLGALARGRPLVVCIDDVQWGDRDSARLFDELLAPPDPPAMLLVLSHRDEETYASPALLEVLRRRGALGASRRVSVGPLSREHAERLALAYLGSGGAVDHAPDEHRRRASEIARESEGNPFFVEQLALHVRHAQSSAAPPSLDTLVVTRLRQLDPAARRLLEVVAVAGRPVAQRIAVAAAGLDADDPRAALAVLRAGSLVRTHGVRDDDPVETFHDRIRESVFGHLDATQRAALHGALADTLRATGAGDAEDLAVHLHGAGRLEEAARVASHAADRAAAALAFDRAADLYRKALEWGAGTPALDERRLLEKRADALVHAGRSAEAAPLYLRAAEASIGTDALELRRRAAEQLMVSGRIDDGVTVLRPVLEASGISWPSTPMRALVSVIAGIVRIELRGLGFVPRRERDAPPELLRKADVAWSASKGLLSFDSIRAAHFLVTMLLASLRAGEPRRVARAFAIYGMVTVFEGDPRGYAKGMQILELAEQVAAPLADPYLSGTIAICKGTASMSVGKWREGLERMEAGIAELESRCTGARWECSAARSSCFNTLLWLGDLREIARRAPPWQRDGERVGDLFSVVTAELYGALSRLAAGDAGSARSMARGAIAKWSHGGFHFQHWLATKIETWCDLYEGATAAARARIERVWRELESSRLLRVQLMAIDALMLRAHVTLAASGSHRRALRSAERHARALDAIGRGTASAAARLVRGQISARRGETSRALAELDDAARGFAREDVALLATCARRLRGEIAGGAEGTRAVDEADADLRQRGVADPARFSALFAAR